MWRAAAGRRRWKRWRGVCCVRRWTASKTLLQHNQLLSPAPHQGPLIATTERWLQTPLDKNESMLRPKRTFYYPHHHSNMFLFEQQQWKFNSYKDKLIWQNDTRSASFIRKIQELADAESPDHKLAVRRLNLRVNPKISDKKSLKHPQNQRFKKKSRLVRTIMQYIYLSTILWYLKCTLLLQILLLHYIYFDT